MISAYRHYILKGGAALLLLMALSSCKVAGDKAMTAESIRGGEARETMSPLYFTGAVRDAYQIAKEIPAVLDGLHCYCECKKDHGHKSLLTCYVDEHAKHCDLCLNEAFMAGELHRQGMDALSIRKAVDKRFSNQRH
ncbi:MAG: PCYCGC domain-containing protein [Deltaproteobacteria bacterium]|nr:PCYCGC domain-containing protein [Deltaproteobacteria bacterium]